MQTSTTFTFNGTPTPVTAGGWATVLALFALLTATTPALAQDDPLIRINAAGPQVTYEGTTFTSDAFFSDSKTAQASPRDIATTFNDAIYLTERITNDDDDPLSYAIPVPAGGTYTVVLHFAETAFEEPGQRVFDVSVEGTTVLDDYDIVDRATGNNTAVVETILNVDVDDGTLDIVFTSVTERAKINAIEVFGTVAPIEAPFAVNAGGGSLAAGALSWIEDDGSLFLEGETFTSSAPIAGTDNDALYQSERFANTLRFLLPGIQDGLYTIELHFAETFHTSAGQRVFNVIMEGETVRANYDIFAQAGGMNTAVVEVFEGVAVSDGILNITFTRVPGTTGSSKISGIAVTSASLVSTEDGPAGPLPEAYLLTPAYPNPFNPETQFTLSVAQTQQVAILAYDLLGREVARIFDGTLASSQAHTFRFAPNDLPSGIYLIQTVGEQFTATQRVVLLK